MARAELGSARTKRPRARVAPEKPQAERTAWPTRNSLPSSGKGLGLECLASRASRHHARHPVEGPTSARPTSARRSQRGLPQRGRPSAGPTSARPTSTGPTSAGPTSRGQPQRGRPPPGRPQRGRPPAGRPPRGRPQRGRSHAEADLGGANLRRADLSGADLRGANLYETIFADLDLSSCKGLESCCHVGPAPSTTARCSAPGRCPWPSCAVSACPTT